MEVNQELIGLIPAAGFATRLGDLPCSKEVFPIKVQRSKVSHEAQTKVASSFLMQSMVIASASKIYMVIREGKWDILGYFSDGKRENANLAYIITESTKGVPFTIDKSYPFVRENKILFGFPDILFKPKDVFLKLLEKQEETDADIVLGLFKTDKPSKMDMVEFSNNDEIKRIVIKPDRTALKYTWITAVWTPKFTEYLHKVVLNQQDEQYQVNYLEQTKESYTELYLGEIIDKAIDEGLNIKSVKFTNGSFIDIGTIEDLNKALKYF